MDGPQVNILFSDEADPGLAATSEIRDVRYTDFFEIVVVASNITANEFADLGSRADRWRVIEAFANHIHIYDSFPEKITLEIGCGCTPDFRSWHCFVGVKISGALRADRKPPRGDLAYVRLGFGVSETKSGPS